ncbi:hypothetical protein HPB51_019172 [Rhipicephalus microplus]|uniref:BTB domain-containing protein n=1 Tax=Rhipicephalus microplus TaxID=6941 RepID=A0A9J6DAY1_RHIMP|nr:hypothetical protein HPB51_019172 [Rhipicephalus microplus]
MVAADGVGRFKFSMPVHFPGVTSKCFRQLLTYFYQDSLCSEVNASNCLELIKLADQLCLPRLVALIEERVVEELSDADRHASAKEEPILKNVSKKATESSERNGEARSKKSHRSSERLTNSPEKAASGVTQKVAGCSKDIKDVSEVALQLLEPCQIHNADQLADWCSYRIATTYKKVLQNNLKLLRNLHPQNQANLNRNRWPPAWQERSAAHAAICERAHHSPKQDHPKPLKGCCPAVQPPLLLQRCYFSGNMFPFSTSSPLTEAVLVSLLLTGAVQGTAL